MEGDYFSNEDSKKDEKPQLIDNPNELYTTFELMEKRIEDDIKRGQEIIYPEWKSLFGSNRNINDTGYIGKLKSEIRDDLRFQRLAIARTLTLALQSTENYAMWADRYSRQLEEHIKAITKVIVYSAFKIIDKLYDEIDYWKKEIEKIGGRISEDGKIRELTQEEVDELRNLFEKEWYPKYVQMCNEGNPVQAKSVLISHGRKEPKKKELLNKWLEEKNRVE